MSATKTITRTVLKPFEIKVRVAGKRAAQTWVQFHANSTAAAAQALEMAQDEFYPRACEVVSVKPTVV